MKKNERDYGAKSEGEGHYCEDCDMDQGVLLPVVSPW